MMKKTSKKICSSIALALSMIILFTACSAGTKVQETQKQDAIDEQKLGEVDNAEFSCTLSISCKTLADHIELCAENKRQCVPEDGWILEPSKIDFYEGESVYDVLLRACKDIYRIHFEASFTPVYDSVYVEGINNLYEFDGGNLSGWMYKVNEWFPNYGCSKYIVKDGDVVCFEYTLDLGDDVGGGFDESKNENEEPLEVEPEIGITEKTNPKLNDALERTAAYLLKTVPSSSAGSVGGDWIIIGLSKCGYSVPDGYYDKYYQSVEKQVTDLKGVLHSKKYTEYSRTVIAINALGKDPRDVAGYNLLTPLGDFDKTIWQGLNGPIWALLAFDSGNYDDPINEDAEVQGTRQLYIDEILSKQLSDGGWCLSAQSKDDAADPDITAMALCALAKYKGQGNVSKAIDKALTCLSKLQDEDGGYSSFGIKNCESAAQVLAALSYLGISTDDERFVKNGNSVLDNLLSFEVDGGGFAHVNSDQSGYKGGEVNQMATEQAFYALVAARNADNK